MESSRRLGGLVAHQTYQQLSALLPRVWQFRHLAYAAEAIAGLRSRDSEILVVDPVCLSPDVLKAVIESARDSGAVPILYCEVTTVSAQILCGVLRSIAAEVVDARARCGAAFLRRRVKSMPQILPAARVLKSVAPRIERLPPRLLQAIVEPFTGGMIPSSAEEFFDRVREPRRSMERVLESCRMAPAGRILAAARIIRYWEEARESANGRLLTALEPRVTRQFRRVLNAGPRYADRMTAAQVADAVIDSLVRP